MKITFTRSLATSLIACTLLGSSCAGSYTPIKPDHIATYQGSSIKAPVQLDYQFDALRVHGGNKKYAKKELKRGYHVVAVRVTNTTGAEVNFSRDVTLYYGDRPVVPVAGGIAAHDMKQGVAIYLLYILLNPTLTKTSSTNGYITNQESSTYYIGPFIAGGNMLGASMANSNFRRDLEQYDLTNRNIKPGETVYGLVCLRESSAAPLRLELRSVAANSTPIAPAPAPTSLPPASASKPSIN
jgi:hypothetical protein